jgi:CubicO group peptidase (beta-lactamase class C family)
MNEKQQRITRIINNIPVKKDDGTFEFRTLDDRMKYYHITAFSFACLNDYKIDLVHSVGNKQYNISSPIDIHTPFMAASISKAVFAVAVMILVKKGVLNLDKDVNEYLEGYQVPAEEGLSNKITLRQILGHLAGLNVDGFGGYSSDQILPTLLQVLNGEPPSKTEKVRVVRPPNMYVPKTPDNPTGPYSGGGFCIAQKVVCDVLKKDFADIMDELVLKPFGMTNSTFKQSVDEEFKRVFDQSPPTGYNATRGGVRLMDYVPVEGGIRNYTELAAGGLWTTAEDLAKFGEKLVNILKYDNYKELSKQSLEIMLTRQENSENGIGFYISPTEDPKVKMFGHTGCNDGFLSLANFLTNGQGVVMLFNSNEGLQFYLEFCRAVVHEYNFPFSIENIDFSEEDKKLMKLMEAHNG